MARRTLLVTDLVDSTHLVAELGDARAAALWIAHDRAARDLLAAHRGREIDRSDGFLLLFDVASDAVAFARAWHVACAGLAISSRVGIHTGGVVLRDNPAADIARGAKPVEVDGIAKPVAARVMSIAPGGRTLLTAAAHSELGAESDAQSHGHWQLKGVAEPIELFEVDAAAGPPADGAKAWRVVRGVGGWRPARKMPGSLPAERDSFVGGAEDLLELARRLESGVRLVSVIGVGGTGKTRLAARFGWTSLGAWPGGAWFW